MDGVSCAAAPIYLDILGIWRGLQACCVAKLHGAIYTSACEMLALTG